MTQQQQQQQQQKWGGEAATATTATVATTTGQTIQLHFTDYLLVVRLPCVGVARDFSC